jgi:glycosyltransferase involved in cell wall biosynthesis
MKSPNRKPIALLIPVFNRQEKLDRALRSLASEADLLTVVVIDDGSEPPVLIESPSPLDVHLIRIPANEGIARALNAGLDYVFERPIPYIARLDSDDVAIAGRFRKQLDFLEAHPSVGMCGTGYHECSPDGRIVSTVLPPGTDAGIRAGMHLRTTLWHPTVMIRTSVARAVGHFDPALTCEDLDYFMRVLDVAEAANLPEALIRYEVGSADSLTGTAARRRALAREILHLKWRRRQPLNPLWWLGVLAASTYYLGINRVLSPVRGLTMRLLDRGGR